MIAITTKYLGPTNARGARIKATTGNGESVTVPYPYEYSGAKAHAVAALELARKLRWTGDIIAGATATGYSFTLASSDRFTI
jgi:protein involved in temperature-dependent protein secretion